MRGGSWRGEAGAAVMEFAIIASALFMLVFGIIQFGIVYSKYEVFQGAAREGARVAATAASTGASNDDVVDRVNQASEPYSPSETPAVSGGCSDDTIGDPVTVSWNQVFQVSLPFIPPIDTNLEIKGVFRCE